MDPGDRRASKRSPCLIPAVLCSRSREIQGTILDYSDEGMFVSTAELFSSLAVIEVRFKHPGTRRLVCADGVVKRIVARGEGQPGVGLNLFSTLQELAKKRTVESGSFEPVTDNAFLRSLGSTKGSSKIK